VVKYSGSLRSDLYTRMERAAAEADLVLVVGSSLSGLASDAVPGVAAGRAARGQALGTVIINLQQTDLDGQVPLRQARPFPTQGAIPRCQYCL
jgi:NAD-dependent SIR2 family protein deacetylase